MKKKSMSIQEFMNMEPKKKRKYGSKLAKVAIPAAVPLTVTTKALAAPSAVAPTVVAANQTAVAAGAGQYITEKSLDLVAHALDPLVELMVALALPVASVVLIGSCFLLMIGSKDKALGMMMNCGLAYVLVQLMPMFINILKGVGDAI
jgi:hypothetical protein